MERYELLPIFEKGMELFVYLENSVSNFSRYHKYTVGADIGDTAREILKLIGRNETVKLFFAQRRGDAEKSEKEKLCASARSKITMSLLP